MNKLPKILRLTALVSTLLATSTVSAFTSFEVSDIRVEGLRRISAGTVFNYLPVKVGDIFTNEDSERSIRSLFKAGFFKDVRLARDGSVLVVEIVERPAVSEIELIGNKDIETEPLLEALKQTGLSQGEVFNQSLLDKVERELNRQYFARGKYGVEIETTVTPLARNRVAVKISISEGTAARIKKIDLIGIKAFDVDDLRDRFELTGPGWLTWYTKSDRYSKQKLAGDLEELRSYYLNRGYIQFSADSTQVTITPDKQDIYVTVNVNEGEQYTIKEIKLSGDLVVPDEELFAMVGFRQGDVFSRKLLRETSDRISDRLGDEGYAFANVNSVPEVDKENKQVSLTLFIDPGKRAYVRRINFRGNTKTADEVLRREMRQMEGAWFSTKKLERSRERLDKLGYFSEVSLETPAVAGAADQVDAEFNVTEKPSGNILAGVGYSQSQGVVLSSSVSQDNFLGSGKQVKVTFNTSNVNTIYSFGYTNPYWTVDGVSRGFDVYLRETDASAANVSNYNTDVVGGALRFGVPVTEYDNVNVSLRVESTDLTATIFSPTEVSDFITANGSSYTLLTAELAWTRDTRNKAIMPDKGLLQSFTAEASVPGADLSYYKVGYRHQQLIPLSSGFIGSLSGRLGYGDSYGDTTSLPFFENFYAGGIRTVRGYVSNSLGPRDSKLDPFGGGLQVIGNVEIIIPTAFEKHNKTLRLSGFYDIGNVFATLDNFDAGELRSSVGLQALWISPLGPMTFALAKPLATKVNDETESFQFTLGSTF